MPQPVLPEVQAAVDALRNRIALTQAEVEVLKKTIDETESIIWHWQRIANRVIPGSEPDPDVFTLKPFWTVFENDAQIGD